MITTFEVPSTKPHSAPPALERKLDSLPSGTRAIVRRIESADEAVHRLMAMGLCVGREIEIVRQGDPLVLRLLSARIGVSVRLARHIVVEPRK